MPSLVERLHALVAAHLPNWRQHLALYAPLIAIVVGLALGLASFASEQTTVYATSFSGSLSPGNVTLDLPFAQVTYIDVNLTQGDCALRLYPATETGAILFNLTGDLPPQWIGCTNRSTTVTFNVTNLILINDGASSLPYSVAVQGVLVQTPWDWLALPGMVIALAGLLVFVPRFMMHEAALLKETYDRRHEKKK